MSPVQGITRYDYKGTHGWLARYYSTNKRVIQKTFLDARYGGDEALSLQAAQLYLRNLLFLVKPATYLKTMGRSDKNRSGFNGITLRKKTERNGAVFETYDVSYYRKGWRCTKSFRVHMYPSQQEALIAALKFRHEMERIYVEEHRQKLYRKWSRRIEVRNQGEA